MKKSFNYLLVILLVVVVAVVAFSVGNTFAGTILGGKLTTAIIPSPLSVAVSPTSPFGSRTVSADDKVAVFDFCNISQKDLTISQIAYGFRSNGRMSFDLDVKLRDESYGGNIAASDITSQFGDIVTLNPVLILSAGQCKPVSIVTDTTILMNQSPAMDDTLLTSLFSVKSSGGKELLRAVIPANTLRY